MKKNELQEIKKLGLPELLTRAKKLQKEVTDLSLDKASAKLANLRSIKNKRRDLAQVLTVSRQKQILEKLETKNG